jgi:hypothetical protein
MKGEVIDFDIEKEGNSQRNSKRKWLNLFWNKAIKFQKHHEILVFMQTYLDDGT